jgi:hypothetical protein
VKYALLIHSDQAAWADLDEDEKARLRAEQMPRWTALFEELGKSDENVSGYELDEAVTAKVVRVRDGERVVTDGPFAETKEAVGGFDLIECDSLEEAVEIAAGHPIAQMGTIEVRPLWGN